MASSSIASAQGTRASLAIGATWVDFGRDWGGAMGALLAQAGVSIAVRPTVLTEVQAFSIVPTGGYVAVADCVPGKPCVNQSSPDMLWGGTASIARRMGGTGWRASLGAGGLTAVGLTGPGSQSTLIGSLGLSWSAARSGLTPTFKLQALGLASRVAGLRYLVLPTVGITF